MKGHAGSWVLAVIIACGAGRAVAANPPKAAPDSVVQEVRRLVHRDFYAPQALQPFERLESRLAGDMAARSARAGGSPSGAASQTIDELLQSLKCSHSARYVPEQLEYYELLDIFAPTLAEPIKRLFPPNGRVTYAGVGLASRWIEGRPFVAHVYDGSPADQAGLEMGDELLTVDGAAFSPIAAFSNKVGKKVEIRVRRKANGAGRSFSVPVVEMQPMEVLRNAISGSVKVHERGGRRFGYLRLWSFADPQVRTVVQEALSSEPLASVEGLVLDLRGRWGGAPPDAGELFVGGTPSMTLVGPDKKTIHANVRWRAPLVAIIDGGTRSGLEVLAYSLQKAGVPLVGANTAGAVLGGRPYMLGDDSLLLLAVMDAIVDGKRLEATGVAPSIEVPFDIRYASGRDLQLARALTELERRSRPGSAR